MEACLRETSLDERTTSLPTSRPKDIPASGTAYSRPSTSETSRPPVAVVGFLGAAAGLPAATIAATSAALTNWVLPTFWSSPRRNSWPAISTRSPCRRGLGSPPSWTPFTMTIAVAEPRRIFTPLGPETMTAVCVGSPLGRRTAAPSKAPMLASPEGSGNCRS